MDEKSIKITKIFFIILIAICAFFRFYMITLMPPDLEVDASIHGIHALKISDGINLDPLISRAASYFWLYAPWHLLLGALFKLFGAGKSVMFIASGIIGVFTIISIFIVAKKLFGEIPALIAAFFSLTSLWYFTYSRYAFGFITIIPLFYLLTLYNLFMYDEKGKAAYLIFAGLLLGAGWLNGYPHILSIIPVFLIYKISRGNSFRNWDYIICIFIGIIIYIIGVIGIAKICNAESIWTIPKAVNKYFMHYKTGERGVFDFKGVLPLVGSNSLHLLKEFFVKSYERDNPAFICLKVIDYPLIAPIVSVFLVIGIIRCFWYRAPVDKLLLVWLFLPFIIYVLSMKKICSRYLLGIFPAVCLLAGREAANMLYWIYKKFNKITTGAFIIIVTLPSMYWLYSGYFVSYTKNDAYLNSYYGLNEATKYIENKIGNDPESIVVFEDEILVPRFSFQFYAKGKYVSRFYYWDEFVNKYLQNGSNIKDKTIAFVFSVPDDRNIRMYGEESKLRDFQRYFHYSNPEKIIRYNNKTDAKLVYILKL